MTFLRYRGQKRKEWRIALVPAHKNSNRTKLIATLLLIFSLALFLVSTIFLPLYPWLSWLKSFSEAASVGAIADWFAVTALFRRPLGLPIPHTAIIARQRDRLAKGLGEFIDKNFLSGDVLREKIVVGNLSLVLAKWASTGDNSKNAAAIAQQIAERSLALFEDSAVITLIRSDVRAAVQEIPFSPLCGRLLRITIESDTEQEISAGMIALIDRFLNTNEEAIERFVAEKLPWYVPAFLHKPTFRQFLKKIRDEMLEIRENSAHPARGKFRELLLELATQLDNSDELRIRGESVKEAILRSTFFEQYISRFTSHLGRIVQRQLSDAESPLSNIIQSASLTVISQIKSDRALQEAFNVWLFDVISGLASHSSLNFSALVQDVISSWDTGTLIDRIETHVGSDLQYIRINGTIIGGLTGVLLHAISELPL